MALTNAERQRIRHAKIKAELQKANELALNNRVVKAMLLQQIEDLSMISSGVYDLSHIDYVVRQLTNLSNDL